MKTAEDPTADRGRRGVPSPEEVERILAREDSVIANLQITLAYHRISTALAGMLGPIVNWSTFAVWASKQAGQSIRGRDVVRTFERLFIHSPEAAGKLEELAACRSARDGSGREPLQR